ncbi:hypothetical protein Pan97_15670 [Bremerella volcania]|uniref:Uncharacterized protein n=1 Tax=Bremerella volcania TaxID=2527984 RepID=A0A518C5Q8_9BACT|nr:hypothetical protein [Bremerella volcania]QDU74558.1 hypothetical protein Pan97_15670 [Bremerella volcania]
MAKLNSVTLVLAILALLLGGVAYWRSGGKQDVAQVDEQVKQDIDTLREKQQALETHAADSIRAGYKRSQAALKRARQRLGELETAAAEGIKAEVEQAKKDLDTLERDTADGAKAIEKSVVDKAREAEQAVTSRVHRLEARVDVIEARHEISRAKANADSQEFDKAEQQFHEAISHIKGAKEKMADGTALDAQIDAARSSLVDAAKAVEAKAVEAKAVEAKAEQAGNKIEKAESDARALVKSLVGDDHPPEISAAK